MTATHAPEEAERLLHPRFRGPEDLPVIESVPLAARGLPASTHAIVERAAALWPHAPALSLLPSAERWDDPVTMTFAQLRARVNRIANVLTRRGVRRTDAVGIVAPNSSGTLAGLLAAQAAGIVAPVNPGLATERVAGLLATAGARVLIAAGPEFGTATVERLAELRDGSPVETVLLLRPDDARGPAPALPEVAGLRIEWLDAAAAWEPDDRLTAPPPRPDDLAAYFHTGGTTGTPKLAVHTHANEVAMAWTLTLALDEGLGEGSIFAALPLFHVNALLVTGLAPLMSGRRAVWAPPLGYREPGVLAAFWRIVERYRIAGLSAVPTVYAALAQLPVDADISSLRFPVVGAAPLPLAVRRDFAARAGVELNEGYGLTEATCASVLSLPNVPQPGTVGMRLPYQHIKAVEVDEATGEWQDLPPGVPGLLVISGPTVFAGYLRDGCPRRDVVVRDGWLDTGDHGTVDDDGFVRLTGRLKDLIIRGGHNIDPAVIEEALLSHPAVSQAAAVGRPHRHSGEVPVAYVSLHPSASATEEELRAWAAGAVPEAAAGPKDVHVVDTIPLTDVGKIYKPALRADVARRLVAGELIAAGIAARVVPGSGAGPVQVEVPDDDAVRNSVRDLLGGYSLAWVFADPPAGCLTPGSPTSLISDARDDEWQ